jgi:RNA polymerase sigma factor for flagellar operon FliA
MTNAGSSGLGLLAQPGRVEAALWRRLRFEADETCRERLFELYADFARALAARDARRRAISYADRGDIEQFAFEGLLQAIDRYDPMNGAPFTAYARRRIAGSIADGIATLSEVGAHARHQRRAEQERLRSLAEPREEAADSAVAALSDVAVGLALGLMLERGLVAQSSEPDPGPTAYESLEWREIQMRLLHEVGRLPEREAAIIRHHYENGLSFARIADLLGLSRGRVSQLHRASLDKLRKRIGAFI